MAEAVEERGLTRPELSSNIAPEPMPPSAGALTPREQQLILLVMGGYSDKEIAGALHLSINTVKNHLANVRRKLHARSRSQAVATVLQWRLGFPSADVPRVDRWRCRLCGSTRVEYGVRQPPS
ncbi:MAG: helix-turn-helix transcriptional regulator [Chloroflexi bacterium]|nr:helix-turn-helix transcriptional regulator [Chloroflexota bacterium]